MSRVSYLFVLSLLLLSITGTACGSEDDGPPFAPTFSEIQTNVFAVSCVFSSCHSAQGHKGDLVLEPEVAYDNLIEVLSDNETAAIANLRRVVPGSPEVSFLVTKLTPGLAEDFGTLMPMGSIDGLGAAKTDVIADWIDRGAADD